MSKHKNKSSEKTQETSSDINELINSLNVNEQNLNCIEKSCDIIKALVQKNELFEEEAYGYKFVSEEQNKQLNKYYEEINNYKQYVEKLSNQIKLYESQKGGVSNDIFNLLKNYSKGMSEDKKKQIKEKYNKYIFQHLKNNN